MFTRNILLFSVLQSVYTYFCKIDYPIDNIVRTYILSMITRTRSKLLRLLHYSLVTWDLSSSSPTRCLYASPRCCQRKSNSSLATSCPIQRDERLTCFTVATQREAHRLAAVSLAASTTLVTRPDYAVELQQTLHMQTHQRCAS